ncbi:prolipoprotein diacylglyceryl transferase family protein [Halanaerobacter jeridensis]|uniref:prolipoprotein diacylglyceryl transferase family protein n=1 Tax=Halanaerobacter jeridensis TaxID=706427 RepID=UPI00195F196A
MAIYLISYSIFRFIIENFRGDNRGVVIKILNLSPSQVVSIFLLILGVLIFIRARINSYPR